MLYFYVAMELLLANYLVLVFYFAFILHLMCV